MFELARLKVRLTMCFHMGNILTSAEVDDAAITTDRYVKNQIVRPMIHHIITTTEKVEIVCEDEKAE